MRERESESERERESERDFHSPFHVTTEIIQTVTNSMLTSKVIRVY